jgi:hypothetical protein
MHDVQYRGGAIGRLRWRFHGTAAPKFTFVLLPWNESPAPMYLCWGGATTCEVDSMRKALNLNSDINAAIRAEIAERLRFLLPKEQSRLPPRIQHLLDRLSTLDADLGRHQMIGH